MPELPEVETVRDGLARHVLGRTVAAVEVRREYSVRRHTGGPLDFVGRLAGRRLDAAVRRGKYLWLLLDDGAALLAHLGMSGQLLVGATAPGAGRDHPPGADASARGADASPHLRVRLDLDDGGRLDLVDQRTFGYLAVTELVPTPDAAPGGCGADVAAVPEPVAHVARDLLDPHLDVERTVAAMRRRRTDVKRALLDQTLVSGVGNIYADEGLWRARLHFARATDALRPVDARRVLASTAEVMREALAAGGTSFDALYVDVTGASGYFERSLAVYGRTGEPCPRCGAPVRRDAFMNRSSLTCPACQPRPRGRGPRRPAAGVRSVR